MPDAFASGLIAPGSTQAQKILQYLDNHGSRLLGNLRFGPYGGTETAGADNVYLYNTARFLADNDQAEQVGLSLYGLLAAGMSPNTFLAGESSSIAPSTTHYYRDSLRPPNATETGNGLELLHQTLIHTVTAPSGTADEGEPTGLQLAYFTPRSWLETGRQVSVTNEPTAFGALTYSLNATSNQTVQGSVTVPQYYTTATPLQLRIRRTAGLNMTGVTVNGAAWSNVDLASGTITLTGAAPGAALTINASFGSSTTAPSVTSISPSTGSAGQTVTVTGTNLSGGAVDFGAEAVAGATCSATSCQAVVPAGSGVVDVTVTTAGGTSVTSTADRFTYSSSGSTPAPTVTAISPTSGPAAGGTAVTVTGTNLTGGTVKFGSVAATGVSCTSTSCAATSPAGSGTVDVTVTTAGGTSASSASDRFTYGTSGTAPTVSAVSPSSGPAAGGTSVTVTGTNLSGGSVKFGAVAATGVTCSTTSCTATSPAGSGAVDVTVTTGAGTSATSAADVFTYGAASGAPTLTVTSVSQSSGNVSFTWTAVPGASSYNLYATATSGSSYFLYAQGLTGTSGTAYGLSAGTWYFVLRAVAGGVESANSNEVSANTANGTTPPVVTGISPASGPAAGGTVVTVSGNNLTGGTVKFGSVPATAVSCASASCTATSPAGSGTVDVTVTTTGGSSATSTSDRFTYGAAGTAPAVSGISPTSGPSAGGTSVTVTGTNLSGGTVKFGAVAATGVSCTATACAATSPAGSGTVDVTVTTGAGTSATSTADVFSYTSSGAPTNLTVTAINHTSGNVSMTWTAVPGASSYNLYATATSGSGYFLYSQGLTGTSGTAYGLSAGTWYFVLRAVSGGVESGNSNQVTAVI